MLFDRRKKAEKLINSAELIHICCFDSEDDDCGPSLMKLVSLIRREGLCSFWFSSDSEGDIEAICRAPVADVYFNSSSPMCTLHLIGTPELAERCGDTGRCIVHFVAEKCLLHTGVREINIQI